MLGQKNSNQQNVVEGYGGDIWKSLQEVMNFSFKLTPSMDGSFNGMIDMILENKVDFIITPMSLTKNRADLVDPSNTLQKDR